MTYPDNLDRTGLAITVQLAEESDVTGMRFVLKRTSCAGEPIEALDFTVDKSIEEIRIPGGIPGFEDQPLDGNSSHAFADLFIDLPAGCYRVTTQPLANGGVVSQDCAPASTSGVRIQDGQTTEIFLINQCKSTDDGRGAIDIISALNHPPALVGLTFEKSKFVYQCQDQVVCATAKDPDNDPLRFTWKQAGGSVLYDGPKVMSTTTAADGSVTQCVRMVAETPERYDLVITIQDLLHDPNSGGLMSYEDYFTRIGDPHPSRDMMTFPFYAASDGRTGGCAATSCKAMLESKPGTPSGLYTIDPDGSGPMAAFQTWCDMTTAGGGWTLLATITNNGDAPNQGNWLVSTSAVNNWESTNASFGTPDPSLNQDFRSPAFHSVPGRALMLTHRNQFLLRTTDQCLGNVTLRDRFVGLGWECGASVAFSGSPACAHPCDIAASTPRAGDTALMSGVARTKLFFKAGEADGAEDVNKDRNYLSTEYRDNVSASPGLGAFCSGTYCTPRQGQADVNDYSDAITPSPGTEFYGIWIR